ncbi:MAG: APC family permease [Candidatus Bathyarchaeia archaeon]
MSEERKIYVRRASGLVRGIGPISALAICFGAICIGGGRFLPLIACISWPGLHAIGWLLLGFILCIFPAILYSQIGGSMPRSGGDYVFVSRVLHPIVGFMMSFVFMITLAFTLGGGTVTTAVYEGVGLCAWTLGLLYKNPAWIQWGIEAAVSPFWWFVLGTIMMVIALIIMLLPMKVWIRVFQASLILSLATAIVMGIIFAVNTYESFVASWNRLLPEVPYTQFISTAEAQGAPIGVPISLSASLAGAVLAYWLYLGYQYAAFFAGEIKDATKSIPIAVLGSLVAGVIGHLVVYVPAVPVVTHDYLAAAGWLFYVTPGALPISFTGIDFASFVLFPNPIWVILVTGGTILTHLAFWMTAMLVISRTMFSWAFDRIMPEKLAYVTERTRTPIVTMIISFILIELGLAVACFMGVVLVHFNWLFIATLMPAIAAIAAITFPLIRRHLLEISPSYVRKGNFVAIAGVISLAVYLFMAYTILVLPAIYGPVTEWTVTWIISLAVLAIIIYLVSRWYRLKTEGIDITLAFKEIPPA